MTIGSINLSPTLTKSYASLIVMGPRGDSHSHMYRYAPAELLPVRYGEVMAG